jgi:histidinol-phosphate aminotransferase
MPSLATEPALRAAVLDLPGYVAGRRAESALTAALASNESHYQPLPAVLDIVRSGALRMNRYPDLAATALRARIAGFLGVSADEVAVGPGSIGVLQQILASVCEAEDEVVFAWRSFEAYPILAQLAGAVPVAVPLAADDGHDLEAMLAAITDRTRVLIVCSPNNPTAVAIEHDTLAAFLAAVPPGVLVVLDEAYVEFVDATGSLDALALFAEHGNVCVLRTFSKAYGLAGLRVGYAIAHPGLAEGLRRAALPFAVSALAQEAAIASLDAVEEIRTRVGLVVTERRRLTDTLRAGGWALPESQANFLWIRADDERAAALVRAFAEADVMVRRYPGDGVRITLADPRTNDRVVAVLALRRQFSSLAGTFPSYEGSCR